MTGQIAALMDHLGLQRCALAGFSLGGLIVQAFALAYPQRVNALVILHAAHGRTEQERASLMARVAQVREHGPASTVDAALQRWFTSDFADQAPRVLEQVRQWVVANDARVYPELYYLLAQADIPLERAIAQIDCPTLVITGEQDYGNSPADVPADCRPDPGRAGGDTGRVAAYGPGRGSCPGQRPDVAVPAAGAV